MRLFATVTLVLLLASSVWAAGSKPAAPPPPLPTPVIEPAPAPAPAPDPYAIGTRVEVTAPVKLNVREVPAGRILGTQPKGARGTVSGGTGALVGSYHWRAVKFDVGVSGYVAQEYLLVKP